MECPSPPNLAPGLCSPSGAFWTTGAAPGVTITPAPSGQGGTVFSFGAQGSPVFDVTLVLGSIDFVVGLGAGAAPISVAYGAGDGILDAGGNPSFPTAQAFTVPEPATAALILAGLVGFASTRRRRATA